MFLLANSAPLFKAALIERIRGALRTPPEHGKAAYLGASNGDVPAFYGMFDAAMEKLGIAERMHVHAEPTSEEMRFLSSADLVLLAAGNVEAGWRAFEREGIDRVVRERQAAGAVLVGTSAGSIHMGTVAAFDPAVPLLSFVPYALDAHADVSLTRRVGARGRDSIVEQEEGAPSTSARAA